MSKTADKKKKGFLRETEIKQIPEPWVAGPVVKKKKTGNSVFFVLWGILIAKNKIFV